MKINKILLSAFAFGVFALSTLVGCEDEVSTENQVRANYVSLMDMPAPLEISLGETVNLQGKVYAQPSGSDRTVMLEIVTDYPALADGSQDPRNTSIDPSDFTVPTSVTIPAGAGEVSFPITITNTDLGFTGKVLSIRIKQEPGLEVPLSYTGTVAAGNLKTYSKPVIITAKRACDENSVTISIVTDDYGSETSWELYNTNGDFIANSVPYIDGGAGETRVLCLPDGDYLFYILDSYGDGFGAGGSYTISKRAADGSQVQVATGSGNFGNFDEVAFSLP
ncbi:DUF4843 domain-containing protein [Flavobacterium sp. J372]|uniref:DUF4843 domain-containing protein n=1 Tax=Flavobacterium sp. J372 TaxID=2898436 RepID=UPI002150747E|nr:DUF4843 domain-containing protein [Flavobacterium sp. J372]MCR5863233.1 DUF4843 domain-containing protein [Flavobacterium sp. J372]